MYWTVFRGLLVFFLSLQCSFLMFANYDIYRSKLTNNYHCIINAIIEYTVKKERKRERKFVCVEQRQEKDEYTVKNKEKMG